MGALRLSRRGVVEATGEGRLRLALDAPVATAPGRCGSGQVGCGQCPGVQRPAQIDWLHLNEYASGMGAGPGATVELSVAAAGLTRAAVWLFGIPLAGLLVGALVGDWLGGADAGAVGMAGGLGMLGLLLGVLTVRKAAPHLIQLLEIRALIESENAVFPMSEVRS